MEQTATRMWTLRTIGLTSLGVALSLTLTLTLAAGPARGDSTDDLSQFGASGSTSGQLNDPRSVAVDGSGNVFVADVVNNRIEVFGPAEAVPEPSSLVLAGLGVAWAAGWARCRRHA